jgi:signal transduction histidine kinase
MNVSFKNRIALYYLLVTSVFVGLTFLTLYWISHKQIFKNLDKELLAEATDHYDEMVFQESNFYFKDKKQWAEREHNMVQVSPIFIQLVDVQGNTMDRSPNIGNSSLNFFRNIPANTPIDGVLHGKRIRQLQQVIYSDGKLKGYMLTAVSSENAWDLVSTLQYVFGFTYPAVLLLLFFITRFVAGKSIEPVLHITSTVDRITKNNLNERIDLPKINDELLVLTTSINDLLQRIEAALEREKQFTSDASHELRTPLAILKGTMEVLIRKERSQEEYKEKIEHLILEINGMAEMLDHLLFIARMESESASYALREIDLKTYLQTWIDNNASLYAQTAHKIRFMVHEQNYENEFVVATNDYLIDILLRNILSNAVKYSQAGTEITFQLSKKGTHTVLAICDQGIGIDSHDLASIDQAFFRSEALTHKEISGVGLGLSIVRKITQQLGIKMDIQSEKGKGTCVFFEFSLDSPKVIKS